MAMLLSLSLSLAMSLAVSAHIDANYGDRNWQIISFCIPNASVPVRVCTCVCVSVLVCLPVVIKIMDLVIFYKTRLRSLTKKTTHQNLFDFYIFPL